MNELIYEGTDEKDILIQRLEIILGDKNFERGIDLGAGPGLLAAPLYSRCKYLTLLELLPLYEKTLRGRFPKAKVEIGCILDYQFESIYDLILLSHVLYYIPEHQWLTVTKKIFDQLSENGLFIIMLLDTRWVLDIYKDYLLNANVDLWSCMDNQLFINQLNFAHVTREQYQIDTVFHDDEAIIKYLTAFFLMTDSSLIEKNETALKQFKNALTFDGSKYTLKFTGHILVLQSFRN